MITIRPLLFFIALWGCTLVARAEEAATKDSFSIYLNKSIESIRGGQVEQSVKELMVALRHSANTTDSAKAYNFMGTSFFKLSDYHTALQYYDSSLVITDTVAQRLFTGYLYNNLGMTYTQLLKFEKAITYYKKALSCINSKSMGVVYYNIAKCYGYLGEGDRNLNYLRKAYKNNIKELGAKSYYTILTELELAEINGVVVGSKLRERILNGNNNLLKGKYFTIVDDFEMAEKYLKNNEKGLLNLYVRAGKWAKAVEMLDSLRGSYLSVDSKLFLQANERQIYKNAIDEFIKTDTLKAFRTALKSHANVLKESLDYTLQELPKNSYNYFDFDSTIYLFVVDSIRAVRFYKINTGEYFQKQYKDFLATFNLRFVIDSFWVNFRQYATSSYFLYQTLLPESSSKMLIIPEGRLQFIPFEALLTEFPDTTAYPYYKYFPYLLNKSDVRYDFILREHAPPTHKVSITALAQDLSLDGAVKEVDGLKKFGAGVYTGNKAVLDKIYTGDILHIATHYNPYEQKLRFADSILDMQQMPNLSKDLTVLSICYSGNGVSYIGEGTFSSSRAFYHAGSKSVVESLWRNMDASSVMLFSNFYDELKKGEAKGTALTLAKRRYLKDCLHYMSHPYFWANLRLFGNNYPVSFDGNGPLAYILMSSIFAVMLLHYFLRIGRK